MGDELDLTNASPEELHRIQRNVLRQLAARVRAESAEAEVYDSHSSSHTKNGEPKLERMIQREF